MEGNTRKAGTMGSYETIRYEPGHIARVVLDRPDRRNAQSWQLLEELDRAFVRSSDRPFRDQVSQALDHLREDTDEPPR